MGYIAIDYKEECKKYDVKNNLKKLEKEYELPDGQIIKVGRSMFYCPELLFKPSLLEFELQGIHQLICNSIKKCDIDIRKELWKTIVIAGGTSMFVGLPQRLQKRSTSSCT